MAALGKNLDLFKATFQKPCHIYKFLKESWKVRPIFLDRTLSYVSKSRNRTVRMKRTRLISIANRLQKIRLDRLNETRVNGTSGIHTCDNNDSSDHLTQKRKVRNVCYFNWICNDPLRTTQMTKSTTFSCPWCEKDYRCLDSLMSHLKLCHLRFNFSLEEVDGLGPVIEMRLNASYDGSYCGFKYPGHDLKRDFRFRPKMPERREPSTQIIYCRARKRNNTTSHTALKMHPAIELNGFDDDEVDVDVCSDGRLYYHTSTCLPVKPNEVDLDSEADIDPDWLRERTQLMIDEFTDVNEGEKEMLKLWNLHIMKNYKYKGDHMMPKACLDFVESEGPTILTKNLSRNVLLHLANMYDFGLISSRDFLECSRTLKKFKQPLTNSPSKTTGKIKSEKNSNEHCQHSTPAKRALLNSHCNQ